MLRPATDADSNDVLRWRNHPEVRAVSLTQHLITAEEHARWWSAVADDPARQVHVYEHAGIPSGVVTFFDIDPEARTAWWGYYLDNEGLTERHALLPAWMTIQREAKRLAFGTLPIDELHGEVLEANEAVRRFNRRNGFDELESSTREVDSHATTVIHVRARRSE